MSLQFAAANSMSQKMGTDPSMQYGAYNTYYSPTDDVTGADASASVVGGFWPHYGYVGDGSSLPSPQQQ